MTSAMPPWAGAPVAPFTTRLVARLLDSVVYLVVQTVLSLLAAAAILVIAATVPTPSMGPGSSTPYDPDLSGVVVLSTLVVILALAVLAGFGYLYEVTMALHTGATWGKRATGIRVSTVAPTSGLTRQVLTRRFLVHGPLGVVVPFFWLLDGAWQLWDGSSRQCLHDKAAGTLVVRAVPQSLP